MVEKTESLSRVQFADGHWATIRGNMASALNEEKIDCWKIKIKPSKYMREEYKLKDKDLDPMDGTVTRLYPKDYCHLIKPGPQLIVWLFLCNFEGKNVKNSLLEKIGAGLLARVNALEKENGLLELSNAVTLYKFGKKINQPDI